WNGLMTHNPTIHRAPDGTYLLYNNGTTYDFDVPTPDAPITSADFWKFGAARQRQRIGLATAPSLLGPWSRPDRPILEPREGKWDALMTTNAAPCVLDDGSVILAYKSTASQQDLLRYGVARAPHYAGPYQRLRDDPIFDFGPTNHVEDACIWREDGRFHLLMKDMTGAICGEQYAGIHAISDDAIHWRLANVPKAYSREVIWTDGRVTRQGCVERPQLLIQAGRPTHLFAATADGPGGFIHARRSWTLCIPLSDPRQSAS
ncbi:MAG TPA: glycoside hydrolase family protein, partial [Tepidisphaeraceae bacterium]|nr:glycoside hydrolase family protein [Tepidisphaeraceae bacterium]